MRFRLQAPKTHEARNDSSSHRASSCPSWDRTRTLLIQSRAVRVCLEDTMSVSGCPPSIGARRLGGQCPDWSGETLAKRLLVRRACGKGDARSPRLLLVVQGARLHLPNVIFDRRRQASSRRFSFLTASARVLDWESDGDDGNESNRAVNK